MLSFMVSYIVLLNGISGKLVVRPTDGVAGIRSQIEFPCGTNISGMKVTWHHVSVGPDITITAIFDSVDLRDSEKYQLNTSSTEGRYDLVIKHTDFSDSGRYICRDDDGFSDETASAQLVVVSEPDCVYITISSSQSESVVIVSNVVEGETIVLKCHVTFAGNSSSTVGWTNSINSTTVNSSTSYNVTQQQSETHGVTTVTVLTTYVDFVVSTVNIQPHNCIVNISQHTAINWTSNPIQVHYPVRNIRVNTTTGNIYRTGDILECLADGSRDVTYRWVEMTSGNETSGSLLELHNVGYSQQYMCIASNVIHNTKQFVSTLISVTVLRPNTALTRPLVVIVLTVTLAVLILVIFVCAVGWRQHRKPNDRDKENMSRDQVEQQSLVEKTPVSGQINTVQEPDSQLFGSQLTEDDVTDVYDEIDESRDCTETTTAASHCLPQQTPYREVVDGQYEALQGEVTTTRVPAIYTTTQRPTV